MKHHVRFLYWLVACCGLILWGLPSTSAQANSIPSQFIILYGPGQTEPFPEFTYQLGSSNRNRNDCIEWILYSNKDNVDVTQATIGGLYKGNDTILEPEADGFYQLVKLSLFENNFLNNPDLIPAYQEYRLPYIQGYTVTRDDNETTAQSHPISLNKEINSSFNPASPEPAKLYYVRMTAHKNTADATKDVTIKQADGTTSDQRTVTGFLGYEGLFALKSGTFNPDTDQLIDDQGQIIPVTTQNNLQLAHIILDGRAATTYTINPQSAVHTVTIHYQYSDGGKATDDKLVHGATGSSLTVKSPTITGYTAKDAKVTFTTADQDVTVTYQENSATSSSTSSSSTTSSSNTTGTPTVTPSTTSSSAVSSPTDSSNSSSTTTGTSTANTATFEPFMIYLKRAVYRYQQPTFKRTQRLAFYKRQPRLKAATFKVVGAARSAKGVLRYRLTDGSYVTANDNYVANLYWQGSHYRKLYVTHPRGIYRYQTAKFARSQRRTHLKKGSTLKIKRIVHRGYLTRYQLTNGQYVTGNKQWVSPTKPR